MTDRGAETTRSERLAWSTLAFTMGLYSLVAQTLLLRTFLGAFDGNEAGIGCFFTSWLIWVALGATVARAGAGRGPIRLETLAWLTLLYLPASVAQDRLLASARALGGVTSWELFPIGRMLAVTLAANAPVSFLTGVLFTLACRSRMSRHLLPARIYMLESLGSFAGGLGVTLLLASGATVDQIALLAANGLALAVTFSVLSRPRAGCRPAIVVRGIPLALLLALGIALAGGLGPRLTRLRDRTAWTQLLPAEGWRGRFATAQATYLYGERQGHFLVMSQGSVCESLPDREHAAEVTALTLSQAPGARQVLVAGPASLAVCEQFARLPQIERIDWVHPDPDYSRELWRRLPESLRSGADKINLPDQDIRAILAAARASYDLVLLDLPDISTLVLNRHATVEFYDLIAHALSPDGVVAVRISGGANFLGAERVAQGASVLASLRTVFSRTVLKPGEESWLLASNGTSLTTSPARLRDRWAALEGAAALYPSTGLLTLYPPDRIRFQSEKYERAIHLEGPAAWVNSDAFPRALRFSLGVTLRRLGFTRVASSLSLAARVGAWVMTSGLLIYLILRWAYTARRRTGPRRPERFDTAVLGFAGGLVGLSTCLALIFSFQSIHGTLYLHAGLIFSLFMLGLFAGSAVTRHLLERGLRRPVSAAGRGWGASPRGLLLLILLAGVVALVAMSRILPAVSLPVYGLLIIVTGVFSGALFPIATWRLEHHRQPAATVGARLETLDHLGGATGGLLTGIVMLPLFGTATSLQLLAGLLAVLALLELKPWPRAHAIDAVPVLLRRSRMIGYILLGITALAVVSSNLVAQARTRAQGALLEEAARELTGAAPLIENTATLIDGTAIRYFSTDAPAGAARVHVFSTGAFSLINGYNGPIRMAVAVDDSGRLLDYRIIDSSETPAYLARLQDWHQQILARDLTAPAPFDGVDTVSGATLSSRAILATLREAGARFCAEILGLTIRGNSAAGGDGTGAPSSPWRDRNLWLLGALLLTAIGLRFTLNRWWRRLALLGSVLTAGFWLNLQYSSQQVASLLSLRFDLTAFNGALFLTLIIPLVVILFGNIYCGSICPFGALQELVGELRPRSLCCDPGPDGWSIGRLVKYFLLALLVILCCLTRDSRVLMSDPLITFFSRAGADWGWMIGGSALLVATTYRRFWCRNLCPAGAFLALLNGIRVLRRLMPRPRPRHCDMGLRRTYELDCLQCDRCHHEAR